MAKTPAWQRKAGKNPKGGLNEAGRRSAKKQGMNLKRPVKKGDNPRRASFLARMGGMKGPERDAKGRPTRVPQARLTLGRRRQLSPSGTRPRSPRSETAQPASQEPDEQAVQAARRQAQEGQG